MVRRLQQVVQTRWQPLESKLQGHIKLTCNPPKGVMEVLPCNVQFPFAVFGRRHWRFNQGVVSEPFNIILNGVP